MTPEIDTEWKDRERLKGAKLLASGTSNLASTQVALRPKVVLELHPC
jgi:hypothetical protein